MRGRPADKQPFLDFAVNSARLGVGTAAAAGHALDTRTRGTHSTLLLVKVVGAAAKYSTTTTEYPPPRRSPDKRPLKNNTTNFLQQDCPPPPALKQKYRKTTHWRIPVVYQRLIGGSPSCLPPPRPGPALYLFNKYSREMSSSSVHASAANFDQHLAEFGNIRQI